MLAVRRVRPVAVTAAPRAPALRRALRVAAAAAAFASLLPLAATSFWVLDLFSHFRAQYLAVAALAAVALAALRDLRWATVAAAAAFASAWPLLPYLVPPGPAAADVGHGAPQARRPPDMPRGAAEGAASVSIVSVNVERGRHEQAPALLALLARTSPDIVLVIELTPSWLERLAPIVDAYPYSIVRAREDPWGIGVFAKAPLAEDGTRAVGPTAAVDALIQSDAGLLRLLGVHLRPPVSSAWSAERNRQLDELARVAAENTMAMIICGDFNISPYSPYFERFLERARLADTRVRGARPWGLEFTWPTYNALLGIPIDHCLVSRGVSVAAHRKLAGFGSDHYPLFVEIEPGRAR